MVLIGWASNPVVATICILLPIIAGFSVGLRILARCVVQKNAGWDDGCIGASLVCFLFSFLSCGLVCVFLFGWGNWDERERGGGRGMDRRREGRRRKREGGWVEERVLWIGSDWTELVTELYCSLSGCLAEREGEEETGLSFFFPPFFLFVLLI